MIEISLHQDGLEVVNVTATDRDSAISEAMHYFAQYIQDGPITIKTKPPELVEEIFAAVSPERDEEQQ